MSLRWDDAGGKVGPMTTEQLADIDRIFLAAAIVVLTVLGGLAFGLAVS